MESILMKLKIDRDFYHRFGHIHVYTHGNKLGNTFSPWGKFKKIHFPFFWRS